MFVQFPEFDRSPLFIEKDNSLILLKLFTRSKISFRWKTHDIKDTKWLVFGMLAHYSLAAEYMWDAISISCSFV